MPCLGTQGCGRGALRVGRHALTNLAGRAVFPEDVVQLVVRDLVRQIAHIQDPVHLRGKPVPTRTLLHLRATASSGWPPFFIKTSPNSLQVCSHSAHLVGARGSMNLLIFVNVLFS